MQDFKYQTLDFNNHSFRLLRILSGAEGRVRCELFDAQLNLDDDIKRREGASSAAHDDKCYQYEALSYTWGGNERSGCIDIDGCTMQVTANLSLALNRLRLPHQDRIIWIDALCIDQSNDKERTHQVGRMSDIYRSAKRVVIWLGESTEDTDMAIELMQEMEGKAAARGDSHLPHWHVSWRQLWKHTIRSRHTSKFRAFQNGLRILVHRDWFQRVWIIQEAANADSAIIMCGKASISTHMFTIVSYLEKVTEGLHTQAILDIMPGPLRQHSWYSEEHDLRTLLLKFRRSKASDPRDAVYALLGMVLKLKKSSQGITTNVKTTRHIVRQIPGRLYGSQLRKVGTRSRFRYYRVSSCDSRSLTRSIAHASMDDA